MADEGKVTRCLTALMRRSQWGAAGSTFAHVDRVLGPGTANPRPVARSTLSGGALAIEDLKAAGTETHSNQSTIPTTPDFAVKITPKLGNHALSSKRDNLKSTPPATTCLLRQQ